MFRVYFAALFSSAITLAITYPIELTRVHMHAEIHRSKTAKPYYSKKMFKTLGNIKTNHGRLILNYRPTGCLQRFPRLTVAFDSTVYYWSSALRNSQEL